MDTCKIKAHLKGADTFGGVREAGRGGGWSGAGGWGGHRRKSHQNKFCLKMP